MLGVKNLQKVLIVGEFLLDYIWAKIAQNGPKIELIFLFGKFWHLIYLKKPKIKDYIVICFLAQNSYLAKFLFWTYCPKYSYTITLIQGNR